MQKSTVNGSQEGSGVEVIVGVMDGTVVGGGAGDVADGATVGDGDVAVKSTFVFVAAASVPVTGTFTQDIRTINRRRFKVRFIWCSLESASLLAMESVGVVATLADENARHSIWNKV